MEIGDRLLLFAKQNFKSVAGLSRAMGYEKAQNIQPYIYNKSVPGADFLIKLAELGCNINWLLLGEEGVSIVRERSEEYNNEFAGLRADIDQLKKEMLELKGINSDLFRERELFTKKIEQLEKENSQIMVENARLRGEVLQLNSVNVKLEKNNKIKG